jgi:hypothetical protein
MRLIISIVCCAAFTATAAAQRSAPHTRALAAGYKAAFLCSGIFNAGQTESQVTADDLTGIYKEYEGIVGTLEANIDRRAKIVSVPFSGDVPPRIAAWRPHLGCAQLPIGAAAEAVRALPKLGLTPPQLEAAWPTGDLDARRDLSIGRAAAVERVLEAAFDARTYGEGTRTSAVVIVSDGRIVGERYRDGYGMHVPQRTWSVAKSLTATLIACRAASGPMVRATVRMRCTSAERP